MAVLKLKANLSIIDYEDLSCRSSYDLIETDSIIKLHALMNPLSNLESNYQENSILLNLPVIYTQPSDSDASSYRDSSHDITRNHDKQEAKEKLYFSHLLITTIIDTLHSVHSKQSHAKLRTYLYKWLNCCRIERSRLNVKQLEVYYRIKQSCMKIKHLILSHQTSSMIQCFYTLKTNAQVVKLPEALKDIKNEASGKYSFYFRSLSSQVNSLYSKQHMLEAEIEEHTSREQKYAAIFKKLRTRSSASPRVSIGEDDIMIALEHENERLKMAVTKMENDVSSYFQGLSSCIDHKLSHNGQRQLNVMSARPAKKKNSLLHLNLALF